MKDCQCGGPHVKGRACTTEAKRAFLEELLAEWERYPAERLGQLISNASRAELYTPRLFTIEDDELLERLKQR